MGLASYAMLVLTIVCLISMYGSIVQRKALRRELLVIKDLYIRTRSRR